MKIVPLQLTRSTFHSSRSGTTVAPFSFDLRSGNDQTKKKITVDFKSNGHGGEFGQLINHRKVVKPNPTMLAFETGLRQSHPAFSINKGRRSSAKAEDSDGQGQRKRLSSSVSDKKLFSSIPARDKKEFPCNTINLRKFELLTSPQSSITKKQPSKPAQFTHHNLDRPVRGKMIKYSLHDGRENYPLYDTLERPDLRNIQPFQAQIKQAEIGPFKWVSELRINKSRKNHKLTGFRFGDNSSLSVKSTDKPVKGKKQGGVVF